MKLGLLFVLCGIAIAAAEPYGTNLTFLESKIIGGTCKTNDKTEELTEGLIGGLVSIQINGKHVWTGGFYQKTVVFTTANAAMEIDLLLKTPNPECTPQVCYRPNPEREKCIPVRDVAVHKEFLNAENLKNIDLPFEPFDAGIILVKEQLGGDEPTIWNSFFDSFIRVDCLPSYVLGWDFSENQRVTKFLEVQYIYHEECVEYYGMIFAQVPFTVHCLIPIEDQGQLQKEDLGAVVIHCNGAVGILSYVSEDGKLCLVSPFPSLPGEQLNGDWIRGNELYEYHNVRAAKT